jgi:hypothetical protein
MTLLVSGVLSMTCAAQTATTAAPMPLAGPIAQVDLHAPSLRDQPNMSGTAAMVDANGDVHLLCVDPDWSESALRHAHATERQPNHPIRFE